MLTNTYGDILATDCEGIVNPINCHAVAIAGLSTRFAHTYPHMYAYLRERAQQKQLEVGVVRSFIMPNIGKCLFNFPVRAHLCCPADLSDIEKSLFGLRSEVLWVTAMGSPVGSLAIPPLGVGVGEGGLEWQNVRELIEECFSSWLEPGGDLYGLKVKVYEPVD